MRTTDCENCMYATHTSAVRRDGQSVIVTSGSSVTCTKGVIHSITIDDDGMHCSDFEPMIEGSVIDDRIRKIEAGTEST